MPCEICTTGLLRNTHGKVQLYILNIQLQIVSEGFDIVFCLTRDIQGLSALKC